MAKNGKMVILRGTSDPSGANKLPDEFGKPAKWPVGALHVRAAEDFARKRGYEPKTLAVEGQQSVYKGKQVREFLKLFAGLVLARKSYENDMELKPDLDIHALYGFSGGAYNVFWILNFLAEHQPGDLQRINLVVVLGLDKQYKRKADYACQSIKRLQQSTTFVRQPGIRTNGRTVGKPSTIPIPIGASCRQRCPRKSRTRFQRSICSVQTF